MGFNSALVDRARVVERARTATRVEGQYVPRDVTGPWFRVRLMPAEDPEETKSGRTRVRRRPELLAALRDELGGEVTLTADQELEVDAARLGISGRWHVDGQPELMSRKVRPIGWMAHVRRIEEPGA